jgi:hypothetical protein
MMTLKRSFAASLTALSLLSSSTLNHLSHTTSSYWTTSCSGIIGAYGQASSSSTGVTQAASSDDDSVNNVIFIIIIAVLAVAILFVSRNLYRLWKSEHGERGSTAGGPSTATGDGNDDANKRNWKIDYFDLEMGDMVGKGTSGKVFKARWRGLTVAVKELTLSNTKEETVQTELVLRYLMMLLVKNSAHQLSFYRPLHRHKLFVYVIHSWFYLWVLHNHHQKRFVWLVNTWQRDHCSLCYTIGRSRYAHTHPFTLLCSPLIASMQYL